MGLFNSAVVAAAFKPKPLPSSAMVIGDIEAKPTPNDPYGTTRKKNELTIAQTPGDFEIYRLTMPIRKDGAYKDFPDFDSEAAIKSVMDMIGEVDEIKLVGKKEWLQEWDSTDDRLDLGDIEGAFEEETIDAYFQNTTEQQKDGARDHWRFAIECNNKPTDVPELCKAVKAKLRAAGYTTRFDVNTFSEILEYDAGWLAGADPDTLQLSSLQQTIERAFGNMASKQVYKLEDGEEGADLRPTFTLRTKRYTSVKLHHTRVSAPVIAVICEQKNLTRIRRLLQELHDDPLQHGFEEFISTKCNAEQRWDCINQHIKTVLSKQYFIVTGEGLDLATTILDEPITFAGKTGTFRSLLKAKGLFAYIQYSKYASTTKLVCQHEESHTTKVNNKVTTISPRAWFINEVIMADNNDWTVRQFNPRHKLVLGRQTGNKNRNQQPTQEKTTPVPINIWQQRADDKSRANSKTSDGNDSIDSLRSQLTEEQATNKKLTEANQKLGVANDELKEKLDKLAADSKITAVRYNAQAERISKQEHHIRELQTNQDQQLRSMHQRQVESDAKIAALLARFDTDELMKNETKRNQPDDADTLSTPETKQLARAKKQSDRLDVPPQILRFGEKTNSPTPPSPSRTLTAITAAATGGTTSGLRQRPNQSSLQHASTSSAKTAGGSK